ncbi:hypothetical protein [Cupriavidus nantongensis]|uniref:hypothetical protein n=1 Tax=Cupriavidus nantongensis TaxID=1796606 RepID=UPI002247DEE1|nr:hypothetical protein [Cupriavidus nantongensis]
MNSAISSPLTAGQIEALVDAKFLGFPLPHPAKAVSNWYLLTVSEDQMRMALLPSPEPVETRTIDAFVDRIKYALRHTMDRVSSECNHSGVGLLPERVNPANYIRASKMLSGGLEYSMGTHIFGAIHNKTAKFVATGNTIGVRYNMSPTDIRYSALEVFRHGQFQRADAMTLIYHWLKDNENRPPAIWKIANTTRLKNKNIYYEYDQSLATALARNLPQGPQLIPNDWRFPWGGAHETVLLINALLIRCIYHFVAVHFGSERYESSGGCESSLCLKISKQKLHRDLELMSSVSHEKIVSFVKFLTYGEGTRTPDIALQPLVPAGSDILMVPCIHFVSSNHQRNLLSLQAKIRSTEFDTQSRLFELAMVGRLALQCQARWPLTRHNVTVSLSGEKEEIDLVIADTTNKVLLVCELRWMIQPGDIREVYNRKNESKKKIPQIKRKLAHVKNDIGSSLQILFGDSIPPNERENWNCQGIVIVEGFGGTASESSNIPIMTAPIFEQGIVGLEDLGVLHAWACSLSWLPVKGEHFELATTTTTLGPYELQNEGLEFTANWQAYYEHMQASLQH